MVVTLVLRESPVSQTISPATIVPVTLVLREGRTVIPSVSLPGTRNIRVQDLRQSFSLSTASYSYDASVSSVGSLAIKKDFALTKLIALASLALTVLFCAYFRQMSVTLGNVVTDVRTLSYNLVRSIPLTLSANKASSLVLMKGISISLLSSLTQGKLFSYVASISSTLSSSLYRNLYSVKSVSVASSILLSKYISLFTSIALAPALSLVKTFNLILKTSLSNSVAVLKSLGLRVSLSASTSITTLYGTIRSMVISVSVNAGASVIKALSRITLIVQSVTSALSKATTKLLIVTSASTAILTKTLATVRSISTPVSVSSLKGFYFNTLVSISSLTSSLSTLVRLVIKPFSTVFYQKNSRTAYDSIKDRIIAIPALLRSVTDNLKNRNVTTAKLIRTVKLFQDDRDMQAFDPKTGDEIQFFTFDFSEVLETNETISSATISNRKLTNPCSLTLASSGASVITGHKVSQKLAGGVPGDRYAVKCQIVTSYGQVFEIEGELPIL